MLKGIVALLGGSNEKEVKKLHPLVQRINELELEAQKLSDIDLAARTADFKARLQQDASLDDLLTEAFACVREAAKRTLGQRHFDVQLMGGIVLHQGKIAEMKTGEGKTLVATLPLYLNALTGKGAHLVTVNDYLARRDTAWMGPIYHLLGLSVACLNHETSYLFDPTAEEEGSLNHLRPISRREAYQADITYGTNNEFGFDYLRDNMALELAHQVQRPHYYAIVDEVDNILIDEARTPLIVSGPADEPVQLYATMAKLAPRLKAEDDYTVDEKTRTVALTQEGIERLEGWLKVGNIYAPENYHLVNYVENALRSQVVYQRDRDYVVKDGEVVIVDEFTGRLMFGRRYSDGLHQAIEAKEAVKVQRESITYATVTLQNYFRMYEKLAGMTGTAYTEADEFFKIYGLEVAVIPTNVPMVRTDHSDFVYKTEEGKFRAVAKEIKEMQEKGRPVLVGTTSIEKSERLSGLLSRMGVKHEVLNAKQHEREAQIIVQAGKPGAITVATNMAGRGTDIVLGGNPTALGMSQEEWQKAHERVVSLGGLAVVGTEHHEARRIDNQLRGRSGRQGDPGSTRFYASLEDDLMRRFGGDRIKAVMNWAGIDEDTPIENRMVTRAIAGAQVRTEAYHFDIRKTLLEYDDVLNRQREVIYAERKKVLSGANLRANILEMLDKEVREALASHLPGRDSEHWDSERLVEELNRFIPLPGELKDPEELGKLARDEIEQRYLKCVHDLYEQREQEMGLENARLLERLAMLRAVDYHWVHHLTNMENLRQGIGMYAVGQRDPLVMYKTEGHRRFSELLQNIQRDIASTIFHMRIAPGPGGQRNAPKPSPMAAVARRGSEAVRAGKHKVGRNDPCPCGSGKKYKKCHGANA